MSDYEYNLWMGLYYLESEEAKKQQKKQGSKRGAR